VVALESTLIAQGLPWPLNLETAHAAEDAIRSLNAAPATIAVLQGTPTVGLHAAEIEELARAEGILKASRRDLCTAIACKATAATTVAATMALAHLAGIRIFATGGIGGVHRHPHDISADLLELSRTPVAVVCAGAKSILDIPATLEHLESLGVPVLGFGTDDFPAFYVQKSGQPVSARIDTATAAARALLVHWDLHGGGVLIAQPVRADVALSADEFAAALHEAEKCAAEQSIRGPKITPFLLRRVAELTAGRSLRANQELVVENARLAAKIAAAVHTRPVG